MTTHFIDMLKSTLYLVTDILNAQADPGGAPVDPPPLTATGLWYVMPQMLFFSFYSLLIHFKTKWCKHAKSMLNITYTSTVNTFNDFLSPHQVKSWTRHWNYMLLTWEGLHVTCRLFNVWEESTGNVSLKLRDKIITRDPLRNVKVIAQHGNWWLVTRTTSYIVLSK